MCISINLLGYTMPGMTYLHMIMKNPLSILFILFISLISGPLNEEFGWRGFALDRLFVKYGFTTGTIILGFIWGIWHLAWFFTPGQAQYDLLQHSIFDAIMFIIFVIFLSFAVSFVYVKTKRSILAGALVHMFSNLLGSQLLIPYNAEISMSIKYTSIFFCALLALYCAFSKSFKQEFNNTLKDFIRIQTS